LQEVPRWARDFGCGLPSLCSSRPPSASSSILARASKPNNVTTWGAPSFSPAFGERVGTMPR